MFYINQMRRMLMSPLRFVQGDGTSLTGGADATVMREFDLLGNVL